MLAFDSEKYTHEADRAALKALKSIPGFSALLKAFMSVWNERQQKILNMSSRIRISEKQMKKYYDMLPPICEKLGILVPELYLEMNVVPNAYTSGDTEPFIVLTSGLLKALPEELIPTILAHECGHIACHHVLYLTMGRIVIQGAGSVLANVLPLGSLLTVPLQIAFYYWMRCSEFSADRVAVLCDGSDRKMQEVCMRMAGWDKEIEAEVSLDAFLEQAAGYKDLINESKWNKTLEFMILSQASHPLMAVRALECRNWYQSESYRDTVNYLTAPAAKALETPGKNEEKNKEKARSSIGNVFANSIVIPEEYKQLPPKPSDPVNAVVYGHVNSQSESFIQVYPETPTDSGSFTSAVKVAEEARNSLSDSEGLIEVNCGITTKGRRYAYSLIKILHEPRTTEYKVKMNLLMDDSVMALTGYFIEVGSPGYREAIIKSRMKRETLTNDADPVLSDWSRDPYDPSYTKGYLMNESEKSVYDSRFPLHPLTEARKFITALIADN